MKLQTRLGVEALIQFPSQILLRVGGCVAGWLEKWRVVVEVGVELGNNTYTDTELTLML